MRPAPPVSSCVDRCMPFIRQVSVFGVERVSWKTIFFFVRVFFLKTISTSTYDAIQFVISVNQLTIKHFLIDDLQLNSLFSDLDFLFFFNSSDFVSFGALFSELCWQKGWLFCCFCLFFSKSESIREKKKKKKKEKFVRRWNLYLVCRRMCFYRGATVTCY